jgi:hypothetical protein
MSKFGEFLESLKLPFIAIAHEGRRFFSAPATGPAAEGRAVGYVIVAIAGVFAIPEVENPFLIVGGLAAFLFLIGAANYWEALKSEISPPGDDR